MAGSIAGGRTQPRDRTTRISANDSTQKPSQTRGAVQTERKRLQDRKSQRLSRERNKSLVASLQARVAELEQTDHLADLIKENADLISQVAKLRHALSSISVIAAAGESIQNEASNGHSASLAGNAAVDATRQGREGCGSRWSGGQVSQSARCSQLQSMSLDVDGSTPMPSREHDRLSLSSWTSAEEMLTRSSDRPQTTSRTRNKDDTTASSSWEVPAPSNTPSYWVPLGTSTSTQPSDFEQWIMDTEKIASSQKDILDTVVSDPLPYQGSAMSTMSFMHPKESLIDDHLPRHPEPYSGKLLPVAP